MFERNWQFDESLAADLGSEIFDKLFGIRQHSDSVLGCDFPRACGADDFVVGDICYSLLSFRGQNRVPGKSPDEGVGI